MDRSHQLELRPLGIDTRNEHTVYMRSDCPVCSSEGFEALTRIQVSLGDRSVVASLNVLMDDRLLGVHEASLSESAIKALGAQEGDLLSMSHLPPLDSMSRVRSKIYGHSLDEGSMQDIIRDLAAGKYSNVEIAAFVTACGGDRMSFEEIVYMTRSMIDVGQRLSWSSDHVYDKHCVGGLPGNRTTPIVVSLVAAYGVTIPKTSSRAITSPAGTADTMETMAPVELSLDRMKKVVEEENACIAWGGSVDLSPADDIMIRVERALDLDSEGQLIASVLSKKAAAGSTHVVIDVPVGPTAKVRDKAKAEELRWKMKGVANAIGLNAELILTDGTKPVGRGIGPALEAQDLLAVLRNEKEAPRDLEERALELAGPLLELSGELEKGEGRIACEKLLRSGRAMEKFEAICRAQGAFKEPFLAPYTEQVFSEKGGRVLSVNNRKIAKLAKLAGAPNDPGAGVCLHANAGEEVREGDPLFTVYAETEGELAYAMDHYRSHPDMIEVGEG